MNKKVTVIFPTYNERGNIARLVLLTARIFQPDEIIVIDDNSQDGTINELNNLHPKPSNLKVIINKPPLGLAKSIEKGLQLSRNNIVAWLDADFSHPPKILNKIYHKIKNNDIVIASWLCKNGRDLRKEKITIIRSVIVNKICQILFGQKITAYTSGYVMINKKSFLDHHLRGDYGEYFIDLLIYAQNKRLRICEVPFVCVSRMTGVSKTSPNLIVFIKRGLNYLKMITLLFLQKMLGFHYVGL